MSDEHLRQLERKWQETRSKEDEAALIREKIRLGIVNTLSVRAAAMLGNQGARAVFPGTGQIQPWSAGFLLCGIETCLRAATIATKVAHDMLPEAHRPTALLASCLRYIQAESDEHSNTIREMLLPCYDALTGLEDPSLAAFTAVINFADWLTSHPDTQAENWTLGDGPFVHEEHLRELTDQAVRKELIPWLVGGKDPLDELYREFLSH